MAGARILIAWHSRTGTAEALARAAADGAGDQARMIEAGAVGPQDILGASAFVFVAPENLAALSGAMKEMFDRCYYPVLGQVEGRPYATLVAAGTDGEGAQRQLDRIATGWRLRRVVEPFIWRTGAQTPEDIAAPKAVPDHVLDRARELGEAMSAGLLLGIF